MNGIILSDDEIRLVEKDIKIATSRVIKPQPPSTYFHQDNNRYQEHFWTERNYDDDMMKWFPNYERGLKAPYKENEVIFIKEVWGLEKPSSCIGYDTGKCPSESCEKCTDDRLIYVYKSDGLHNFNIPPKWKPSINMPEAAARTFLRILDVRVGKVKDITNEQAAKEGCSGVVCTHPFYDNEHNCCTDCMNSGYLEPPKLEFINLWNSKIKKKDFDILGYNANPWAWIVEFRRVRNERIL